jgi:uncharacterized protein
MREPVQPEPVSYLSGGEEISGWYFPAATSGPAVVLCPGFTGTKFADFYTPYIAAMVELGISVLVSDYRGWGESGGNRGEIVPSREVEDVRNALSFLETRPEVDRSRLWLFGVSFGGGIAVQTAGLDRRVRLTVAVSPVADGSRWLREMRREYEWQEFLDAIERDRRGRVLGMSPVIVPTAQGIMIATPERAVTAVKGALPEGLAVEETPLWCAEEILSFAPYRVARTATRDGLLLFAVENDVVVRPSHAERIAAHAGSDRELVMLRGGGHYEAYVQHADEIIERTRRFVSERLDLSPR